MKTLLFIVLIFISFGLKAQLYFRNNTTEPVIVAICLEYNGDDSKYWGCEGWFRVDPGDKKEVSSAIGFNNHIYYYAISTISKIKYEGDSETLVDPTNEFFIKNADMEYQKKENPQYQWYKFRHVNMNAGLLQLVYTIELNY